MMLRFSFYLWPVRKNSRGQKKFAETTGERYTLYGPEELKFHAERRAVMSSRGELGPRNCQPGVAFRLTSRLLETCDVAVRLRAISGCELAVPRLSKSSDESRPGQAQFHADSVDGGLGGADARMDI
jgi:hypothetical protein